jgi:hypothetical protein
MKPLPCPFCGKKPEIRTVTTSSWVVCEAAECPANPLIEAKTRQKAIQKWNDRPAEKAVA